MIAVGAHVVGTQGVHGDQKNVLGPQPFRRCTTASEKGCEESDDSEEPAGGKPAAILIAL